MMDEAAARNVIKLDLPATYKYLNVLGAVLTALMERVEGVEERTIVTYNLELALHETCTNIVEHAYSGKTGRIGIVLTLMETPRRLVVDLHDTGASFDLQEAPNPNLDQAQENGYGLFLMHQLVDEVVYEPQQGNNRWRLVENL